MTDAASTVMLMVEDNGADVFFFREALQAAGVPVALHVVGNGSDALDFLRRHGDYREAPRPRVVVLDLNLPIMNGREMLERMMAEPELKQIPVAVFTSSRFDRSVCELCPPGRCLYLTKTANFHRLQDIIRQILDHAANPSN